MSFGVSGITQKAFDTWANQNDFGTEKFKNNFNESLQGYINFDQKVNKQQSSLKMENSMNITVFSYLDYDMEVNNNSTFISTFVNGEDDEEDSENKILNKEILEKLRDSINDKTKRTWSSHLPWRVGSDIDNNIWIDSEDISKIHAEIY